MTHATLAVDGGEETDTGECIYTRSGFHSPEHNGSRRWHIRGATEGKDGAVHMDQQQKIMEAARWQRLRHLLQARIKGEDEYENHKFRIMELRQNTGEKPSTSNAQKTRVQWYTRQCKCRREERNTEKNSTGIHEGLRKFKGQAQSNRSTDGILERGNKVVAHCWILVQVISDSVFGLIKLLF